MAATISEAEVVLLHQAISFRKPDMLAKVVFKIENVMNILKSLLIEENVNLVSF